MKTCTKCHKIYPIEEFHGDKNAKDGKRSQCRHCVLEANRAWQAKNPEHAKETWKRAAKKRYTTEERRRRLLKAYGLTEGQYATMRDRSNGCHICGVAFDPNGGRLHGEHIDHCHRTGKVRGLLCFRCNTAIGSFNDDPEIMKRAIAYVEQQGFYTEVKLQ